jgi:hypothetical protein
MRTVFVVIVAVLLDGGSLRAQDVTAVFAKLNSPAALAKVQEKLAADAIGSRVRVDRVELEKGTIVVAGVILVPGATDEDFTEMEKSIHAMLVAVLQEVADARPFQGFDFAKMKSLRGDKLPHLELQRAANVAGKHNHAADQLMLADAKFNAKGKLVITGRRGPDAKTMQWLQTTTKDAKLENVVFDLTPPAKDVAWPITPAELQSRFAKAGTPWLRVDRAYLAATSTKADDTNPTGVAWTYVLAGIALGTAPVAKDDVDRITRKIIPAAFADAKWPEIDSGNLQQLFIADVRVPDPATRLQAAIANTPALDGVRIDQPSSFDGDGKLVLAGVHGLHAKGEEILSGKVRDVLIELASGPDSNKLYAKLAERGLSVARLEKVKVRELHAALRNFAAKQLDETRLGRLYYDANGTLTLDCDTPHAANSKLAMEELKALAAKHRVPFAADPKREPAVQPSPAGIEKSLVAHLQAEIAKNPKWHAVLIERGYFNDKDQFILRGVADSEMQKQELAKLLASLAKDDPWASYFTLAAAPTPELAVIPIDKLVDRVQRVMPAYAAFDGIRITAAKYVLEKGTQGSVAQTLVFTAHVVGRTNENAPTALEALIKEDAKHFARRLPKGRAIRFEEDAKQPNANKQLAEFSVGFAADALARGQMEKAKEWLDVGLLHYPADSAIWFLSAYYNHLRGDEELARRDLFRTIAIESKLDFNGRVARDRRYTAAKDIQGEKRDELEKLWLQCWKESKDGIPAMKFAKEK